MGPIFHPAALSKRLEGNRATMGYLALLSAVTAFGVLGNVLRLAGDFWTVVNGSQDTFLLGHLGFMLLLYLWLLNFLVSLFIASFKKWRSDKI